MARLGRSRQLNSGGTSGRFIEEERWTATILRIAARRNTRRDPKSTVLAHTSRRLEPMNVTTVEADVLKPLPVDGPFDSAALNYVLHCLPGPQSHKAAAIRNVAAVLAPNGALFGGTVLGVSGQHTPLARAILWAFNRRGSFDNLGDTEAGLREILEESFQTVQIDVVGPVAHSPPPARTDQTTR